MEAIAIDGKNYGAVQFRDMAREPYRPSNPLKTAIQVVGTTDECARLIGVPRATLTTWVLREDREPGSFGKVSYRHVMALARATGIPPRVLTGIPDFDTKDIGKPLTKSWNPPTKGRVN